jgi:hypothetical protein
MPDTQQLLQMKEQIDKAGKKDAELKGQLKEQLSRLKKEFDCTSMEEGEKKLDKLQQDLKKKQDILSKGIAKLQEKMEGVDE